MYSSKITFSVLAVMMILISLASFPFIKLPLPADKERRMVMSTGIAKAKKSGMLSNVIVCLDQGLAHFQKDPALGAISQMERSSLYNHQIGIVLPGCANLACGITLVAPGPKTRLEETVCSAHPRIMSTLKSVATPTQSTSNGRGTPPSCYKCFEDGQYCCANKELSDFDFCGHVFCYPASFCR